MTAASHETETAEETQEAPCAGTKGMTHRPARNCGEALSGKAVTVAWRNAKRMIREGYLWQPDGVFYNEGGCVRTPTGKCYDVWLPGVYPDYPEGRCSCPYFAAHLVCKHVYFAVADREMIKAFAPAAMDIIAKKWADKERADKAAQAAVAKVHAPAPAPGF